MHLRNKERMGGGARGGEKEVEEGGRREITSGALENKGGGIRAARGRRTKGEKGEREIVLMEPFSNRV